jgi:CheY-like chemotaxis protein
MVDTSPVARLLVVDDEPAQMKALCHTLEHEGYSASGFTSALQALDTLRSGQSFDMLLTDLMMPEMDGIACVEHLRSVRHDVKIILLSGHAEDAVLGRYHERAPDFLPKPFRMAALEKQVLATLGADD